MPRSDPAAQKPTIPPSFIAKKAQILAQLTRPEESYADHSPKGIVDAQIRNLLDEINAYDGLVTTSSCAGRVAVFVEGPKRTVGVGTDKVEREDELGGAGAISETGRQHGELARNGNEATTNPPAKTTSPGGKGGGRWLFVAHDPISFPPPPPPPVTAEINASIMDDGVSGEMKNQNQHDHDYFTKLFSLSPPKETSQISPPSGSLRVIRLSFSPLILHIHCATLQHARPLLAAAINAGFRESGIQGLRVMDDPEHGVMVAVRTAGLGFETVVGVVISDSGAEGHENGRVEMMQRIVSEEYLTLCVGVINERFQWNGERRERFRMELKRAMGREGWGSGLGSVEENVMQSGWEDKDERRRTKREKGRGRQRKEGNATTNTTGNVSTGAHERKTDDLDGGLAALEID
ncbi:uncharacterized protein Z518_01323 [Rhinocladiella mackenziei CBS 650.93]|uniref:tRNA(Phe) 7-[(3-amino-3-carboxypropyl)-4-demethylwyosine(37)-N(4)]-methyltransferase n=1 Tax=Rhinocladiella mackenziei CBS 650.93 TaxID=1442369 RepID=A0A0D2G5Q4_9EURO|nr:uncharacterized protein Z518_01323 [Rhinocladiella mackenziei CBS 650.93]KIX10242.1 hypothetical protein Z518_01323 [Rhinocladiella mackenziei CBS 650.93]